MSFLLGFMVVEGAMDIRGRRASTLFVAQSRSPAQDLLPSALQSAECYCSTLEAIYNSLRTTTDHGATDTGNSSYTSLLHSPSSNFSSPPSPPYTPSTPHPSASSVSLLKPPFRSRKSSPTIAPAPAKAFGSPFLGLGLREI